MVKLINYGLAVWLRNAACAPGDYSLVNPSLSKSLIITMMTTTATMATIKKAMTMTTSVHN